MDHLTIAILTALVAVLLVAFAVESFFGGDGDA